MLTIMKFRSTFFAVKFQITMSAAIDAFNTSLTEFVADLAETFPDHAKLVFVNASLPALLKANDRAGLDFFVKKTEGLTDRILKKDASIFDGSLHLIDGVDLSSMFNDAGLDDVSRASIWSYLGSLTLLANTLTLMPESAIGMIEQLAKSTADKVKSGEVTLQELLPSVVGDVAGLLGIDPADAQLPDGFDLDQLLASIGGGAGPDLSKLLGN